MADVIKVGDMVRQGGRTYSVLAVEGIYLWLECLDGSSPPFTGLAAAYQRVQPFFEPGERYHRLATWSIHAQAEDVTERFDCTVVEREGSGRQVAFGRLTVPTGDRRPDVDKWVLFSEYDYNHLGWQHT